MSSETSKNQGFGLESLGDFSSDEIREGAFNLPRKPKHMSKEAAVEQSSHIAVQNHGMFTTQLQIRESPGKLTSMAFTDLQNVIDVQMNTMVRLFSSKGAVLGSFQAFVYQQTQEAGAKDPIFEELARAVEADTARSGELEKRLRLMYATGVKLANRL